MEFFSRTSIRLSRKYPATQCLQRSCNDRKWSAPTATHTGARCASMCATARLQPSSMRRSKLSKDSRCVGHDGRHSLTLRRVFSR
ncbi:hypothetical protein CYMTET_15764 [Cymbomonas tetramitiformis]|uniref:Uncharacterized protein n=1 Tax=Cymbomonas tetramitiformis TaxID=36881 RepID=A0AAE0GDP9_9CHLO|nr:hypothetical protein CYMTET_15764 [Cymbomonas tetramitiformis]